MLVLSSARASGKRRDSSGPLGYRFRGSRDLTRRTPRPEADEIARIARAMLDARRVAPGDGGLVASRSRRRADGMHVRVAAFTNLTQDHLDFHGVDGGLRRGQGAALLGLRPRGSVVNVDDPFGRDLAARIKQSRGAPRSHRVGEVGARWTSPHSRSRSSLKQNASPACARRAGEVAVQIECSSGRTTSPTCSMVVGCRGRSASISKPPLQRSLEDVVVPGRLERCDGPVDDVVVLVDYAHTPDALERAARLDALRRAPRRRQTRLVCVFGCGGDRDPTKRAPMGRVGGRGGPTSPSSPPTTRAARIPTPSRRRSCPGSTGARDVVVELDRARAIAEARSPAPVPGDVRAHRRQGARDVPDRRRRSRHRSTTARRRGRALAERRAERKRRRSDGDCHSAEPRPVHGGRDLRARPAGQHRAGRRTVGDRSSPPIRAPSSQGAAFVALTGDTFDGHAFSRGRAGARGEHAGRVARRRDPDGGSAPAVVRVDDTRVALGALARTHRARVERRPQAARLVAITGSAGKTTTSRVARAVLDAMAPGIGARHGRQSQQRRRRADDAARPRRGAIATPSSRWGPTRRGEIARARRSPSPTSAVLTLVAAAHTEGLGSHRGRSRSRRAALLGRSAGQRAGGRPTPTTPRAVAAARARNRPNAAVTLWLRRPARLPHRLRRAARRARQSPVAIAAAAAPGSSDLVRSSATAGALAVRCASLAVAEWAVDRRGDERGARRRAVVAAGEARRGGSPGALGDGTLVIDDSYNANPASMQRPSSPRASCAATRAKAAVARARRDARARRPCRRASTTSSGDWRPRRTSPR